MQHWHTSRVDQILSETSWCRIHQHKTKYWWKRHWHYHWLGESHYWLGESSHQQPYNVDSITSKIQLPQYSSCSFLSYSIFILLQLCFRNISSVYECSQHYPIKEDIDLTVMTFSTCILKWKVVFYFQVYLVSSYVKENTRFSMITFVHIVFRKKNTVGMQAWKNTGLFITSWVFIQLF